MDSNTSQTANESNDLRRDRAAGLAVGIGGWVDTHGHIQLTEDPPEHVLEHGTAGVDWLVAPGVDLASSEASMRLERAYPGRVMSSAGLHPHDAASWPKVRDQITELAAQAAAVGETGLDFYRNLAPRDAQIEAFTDHVRMAHDLGKPLIVHCRDAFAEVHDILAASDPGPWMVLHCWTGGPRWTKRFLELDVTFSFAGPVAFEAGDTVRRGAAVVPPNHAVVETDTPYLSPPPFRGEVNVPSRVALVGAALARVWGMEVVDVARLTSSNAARVFRDG